MTFDDKNFKAKYIAPIKKLNDIAYPLANEKYSKQKGLKKNRATNSILEYLFSVKRMILIKKYEYKIKESTLCILNTHIWLYPNMLGIFIKNEFIQ